MNILVFSGATASSSQAQKFICYKQSCHHCGALPCSSTAEFSMYCSSFSLCIIFFHKGTFWKHFCRAFSRGYQIFATFAVWGVCPWIVLFTRGALKIESGTAKRKKLAYSIPVGSFASLSAALLSPCPARRSWIRFPKGKSWDSEVKWVGCTEGLVPLDRGFQFNNWTNRWDCPLCRGLCLWPKTSFLPEEWG